MITSGVSEAKTDSVTAFIKQKCIKGCIEANELLSIAIPVAKEAGVAVRTVIAIITIESGFRVKVASKGNYGLMQVLLKYHAKKFKTKDYFDPNENIKVGTSIFKDCLKRKKTIRAALTCYNGGADKDYPDKVMAIMQQLTHIKLI